MSEVQRCEVIKPHDDNLTVREVLHIFISENADPRTCRTCCVSEACEAERDVKLDRRLPVAECLFLSHVS